MTVQGIQSLEVGARVLMAAARYPRGAALRQLAADAGVSASQAHRYLTSWVRTGFMKQDGETGNYALAEGSLHLGLAALRGVEPIERAAAALKQLVEDTGQTGMLTVWSEAGPVCVRWLRGTALVGTDAGLGSLFPVLGSAVGRLFAAHLPAALVEPLATAELKRLGEPASQAATRAALDRITREVRHSGFALARGHFVTGIDAIAAPVWDFQDQLVAGLGLVLRDADWRRDRAHYERVVLAAASQASLRAV